MKRKTFIFILMAAIAMLALGSCLSTQGSGNAQSGIDWEGVYKGTIPAADGPGINVSIKLNKDQSFEMSYEYIDKGDKPFTWTGNFKWDDTGNIIIIDIIDAPNYYKVEKTRLIQLDMEGKPIKGKLAANYVLKKVL
jgi:uncharacterized lipoprotein NlpE involved in copper resistance